MIPQDFIDQLLSRVDIVDVVDRYVPLKKAGQNYLACCPFHKEKSPSFTVSPSKQFYHCFGCGAHGSAIGFVMEYQGLNFVDAVRLLADSLGMPVPEERRGDPVKERAARERRLSLEEMLASAAAFYKQQLKSSALAVSYLKGRGVTGEIAARYALGFAPDARIDAVQPLATLFTDYQDERLVEGGLVIAGDDGKRYDRFRARVMFPIRNQRGGIIGFGGRILSKEKSAHAPKYLNSPETPLFEKGRELYGLYEARQAIREQNRVLVVEGYMDVVALAQFGVGYAVATLGTATTGEHVRKLLRHADQVYFCFDGDAAGRKAAWRALENSLPQLVDGKALHFLFLPQEHDPDSYIRAHGAEAFERLLLEESLPLSAYFVREMTARVDMSTPEGHADLIRQATPMLGQIGAPALGFLIRKRLAELTGIDLSEFERLTGVEKPVAQGRREYRLPKQASRVLATSSVRQLVKWLLMNPEWAMQVAVPDSLPFAGDMACLVALIDRVQASEQVPTSARLEEAFRGTPYEAQIDTVLQQALRDPAEMANPDELDLDMFRDGVRRLLESCDDELFRQLSQRGLEHLSDEEKRLMQELMRRMAARTVHRPSE